MTKIIPPEFITKSEEQLDKGYDPQVAQGLFQFLKPYYARMIFALLMMIIVTAASVSGPYFVKLAIDEGIAAGCLLYTSAEKFSSDHQCPHVFIGSGNCYSYRLLYFSIPLWRRSRIPFLS